ncbi:MAG TPA: cellulase family glycosylhydrolase [Pseudonocardia sp.]|jgi:hypothetical protein|uniref:cellulase family glycosylhydrolase n=1 Tax=Pseudonocardia sp. TaxID=60912 RepID=UPI002F3ED799
MSDSQRQTQFAQLADLGTSWLRVGVPWYAVQPTRNGTSAAELGRLDSIVADATSLGLHVLFIGDQAPDWAGGGGATASDPAAYGAFMGVLAQHFAGRDPGGVTPAYELMNEPDGAQPDGQPWATPTQYAAAACAAYHAIKKQDNQATVLAGSLDVSDWSSWLSSALRDGLIGCFDALSAHPYGELSVLNDIRSTAASAGAPNVNIWVTEFGYSTCDAVLSSCVSQADQAHRLVQRLRQLAADYPWVPVAMVYQSRDEPADSEAKERSFGLFGATGTAKPAVAALRVLYRGGVGG